LCYYLLLRSCDCVVCEPGLILVSMEGGLNLIEGNSGPAKRPTKTAAVAWGSRMKTVLGCALILVMVSGMSAAKELPEAPSSSLAAVEATVPTPTPFVTRERNQTKVVDLKFTSLAIISTGSAFADSYTTLWARQNWLAGKQGVCNMEVESAYLYGTHPTVVRTYAVASVKSVGAVAAAYYLRKHHSKLWSLPLIANSAISLQGVTQNFIECQ